MQVDLVTKRFIASAKRNPDSHCSKMTDNEEQLASATKPDSKSIPASSSKGANNAGASGASKHAKSRETSASKQSEGDEESGEGGGGAEGGAEGGGGEHVAGDERAGEGGEVEEDPGGGGSRATPPSPESVSSAGVVTHKTTSLDSPAHTPKAAPSSDPSNPGAAAASSAASSAAANARLNSDPSVLVPSVAAAAHAFAGKRGLKSNILVNFPPNRPAPPALRRSTTTMSSVDSEILEKQEVNSGDECDGFINQINKDGHIEQVPVKFEDEEEEEEEEEKPAEAPISDFMAADILTKPFNFVSGNVRKSRFNPFRKKSGLLNVLAKQSTKHRFVAKNGVFNTISAADGKAHHFFKDFFITLLDLKWSWIFVLFAATFFLSWLLFATAWYITALVHGDLDEENQKNESFRPCVDAIEDFTSCFLFSIETQHTIGYGGRATTEQCPPAIIIMCLQSIVGVIIQACMAGIIFAKFTVPRARGETIVFSKNAVVTMRNGALYILCRITDLRKYSLLEAHVRMIVIRKEKTDEGEVIPYQQTDLECGSEMDGSNDRVFILWPVTISHKIDDESPFFEMSPRELLTNQFELVVTMEGVTEETGNTVQARTSYLPNEILWGHHFENECVIYDKKTCMFTVQHSILNKTVVDLTPRCSAKQMAQRREKRTSSAMTTSSSEEISPRTTFRVEQKQ